MQFFLSPYHCDLLKDTHRIAAFYDGINDYIKTSKSNEVAFDLGSGVGILSYFLVDYFQKIYSVEINPKTAKLIKKNLSEWSNVEIINDDAKTYKFTEKADLIVCEMLDTGLIDEEQVDVLNHALDFLKPDGEVIPSGVINIAEPVEMMTVKLDYDDFNFSLNHKSPEYNLLGEKIVYQEISFKRKIKKDLNINLNFKINSNGVFNAVKISTYTLINEKLIAGPSSMLNPPLFIPLKNHKNVYKSDSININLIYTMGEGLETVDASIV